MSTIYTVGHSTRPIDEFINMLTAHGVKQLVDVRTMPRSRTNPQFNIDVLPQSLSEAGITYSHIKNLGGLRKASPTSPNTAWRNASFRGYADYMQTDQFQNALTELIEEATDHTVAIMCAEAVPWRCHRSLVADSLVARGHTVAHIMSAVKADPHKLRPWAQVRAGGIVQYPPEPGQLHLDLENSD
jgi:uncharacterized protein (DUF488 family)